MMNQQRLDDDRKNAVARALDEDIGSGDITAALVDSDTCYHVKVITREPAIICGAAWVNETFQQLDPAVALTWHVSDGDRVNAGDVLFEAHGNARSILTAERTALNFLQLLSGTATIAGQYASAVEGTSTRILDTRKTLPGLRTAQKYAVSCGGCHNHRIGLYDAYLIKENHIAACGSIERAISQAKANDPDKPVEIEVETLEEFRQALLAGADIIMLDEFSLEHMKAAVTLNRDHRGAKAKLEASGNISLANIREIAETGVDFISIGSLTKHVQAIDLSMRFLPLD